MGHTGDRACWYDDATVAAHVLHADWWPHGTKACVAARSRHTVHAASRFSGVGSVPACMIHAPAATPAATPTSPPSSASPTPVVGEADFCVAAANDRGCGCRGFAAGCIAVG